MTAVTDGAQGVRQVVREDLLDGARTLGTITCVGVVTAWLVVGVLARLAMFLLVVLNPQAAGVTSDDGFVMGQFTLSGSFNLMFLAGTLFGVLGSGLYAALRGLLVGPGWFRLLSISVGGGVTVGALAVHDGIDFRLLDPAGLAVAIFVALPVLYVALLHVASERLLAGGGAPVGVVVAGMAAWVVVFPLLVLLALLAAGHLALRTAGRTTRGAGEVWSGPAAWLARGVLAVVFVLAVLDLARDVARFS